MIATRPRGNNWKPVAGAATIGAIVNGLVFKYPVAVMAGAAAAALVASRRDAIGNSVCGWSRAITSNSLERLSEVGAAIDHCVMKQSHWKRRQWLERRKAVGGSALLGGMLGLAVYRDPLTVLAFAACGTLVATRNDGLGSSARACGGSLVGAFENSVGVLARGLGAH
eukprot:jgi/Mesvir1/3267/Mv16402-RA.1